MKNTANEFVGKSLGDVRKLVGPKLRIMGIGEEKFFGTCDFLSDRLNVTIDDSKLPFKMVKRVVGEREIERKVFDNIDDGIVTEAHWG